MQLDIEALLKWSNSVPGLTIADRMFNGVRGVIPEQWCLVALLKDESKYVVGPNTGLTRSDLERIASFHWLRPDLVAKLPRLGTQDPVAENRQKRVVLPSSSTDNSIGKDQEIPTCDRVVPASSVSKKHDDLVADAINVLRRTRRASTSMLQRSLRIN